MSIDLNVHWYLLNWWLIPIITLDLIFPLCSFLLILLKLILSGKTSFFFYHFLELLRHGFFRSLDIFTVTSLKSLSSRTNCWHRQESTHGLYFLPCDWFILSCFNMYLSFKKKPITHTYVYIDIGIQDLPFPGVLLLCLLFA